LQDFISSVHLSDSVSATDNASTCPNVSASISNTSITLSNSFNKNYVEFVAMIKEPTSYAQAKTDPNWVQAMAQELKALEDH